MPTMKTEKACYDYASALPYNAAIIEITSTPDGNTRVVLDKTIFYPEGGGQPADRGTINGIPLLDVQEKNGVIFHLVAADASAALKPGPAELVLDSRRRRDITVQHTGQHLLSGTIFRLFGGNTVSMHLGDETCTIDIDIPEMSADCLLVAEEAVAAALEENLPVIIHLCPPEDISTLPLRKFPPQGEDVIRVVEIKGIDFSPCCGTHLKSTAEIGVLRILNAEKYKGMTRITFIVGRRVLLDSRLLRQNAAVISRVLSVPLGEIGRGVLEFLEKANQTEARLKVLEAEAAQVKALALFDKAASLSKAVSRNGANTPTVEANPVIVVESYATEGIDEVISVGKAAQKEARAALILVLAAEKDLKFAAFCTEKSFDLRPVIKKAFDAQGGRGGGNSSFFQGSFETKEDLDTFLGSVVTLTD